MEALKKITLLLLVLFITACHTTQDASIIQWDLSFTNNKSESIEFNPHVSTEFEANIGTYFFEEMGMNLAIIEENEHLFLDVQGSKLILANYKENILSTAIYGIELEINPDNNDEIVFNQNGMQATLNRTKE